jgi:hypothetical protein
LLSKVEKALPKNGEKYKKAPELTDLEYSPEFSSAPM